MATCARPCRNTTHSLARSGASARLTLDGEPAAQTDVAGRARLSIEANGTARVAVVQAEGFGPRKATLTARSPDAPQRVRLQRCARIVGTAIGASEGSEVIAQVRDYELHESTDGMGSFRADSSLSGRVRGDGSFALEGLPANVRLEVRLVVPRPKARVQTLPDAVRLEPGESREVHFSLESAGRIVGRALYEDGTPADGIEFQLVPSSVGRVGYMESFWSEVDADATDADGRFVFENVEPGRWIVGPEPRQKKARADDGFAPVATAVVVRPGDVDVPLEVRLHRGLFVSGVVLGPGGAPASAYVSSTRAALGSTVQGRSRKDGTFRIGPLEPGPVRVRARPRAKGRKVVLLANSEQVESEAGSSGLELRLRGGGAFTVRAVEPGTGEVLGGRFVLSSEHTVQLGFGFDDSRTYDQLPAGTYSIHATTRDGRAGHVGNLVLREGEHQSDIRIPVEPAGTLRVRNAAPAGVLGVSVLRRAVTLASAGVQPGDDLEATLVPGPVEVVMVLRDWSSGAPVEMKRETRTVDLVVGETVEVVFDE